MTTKCLDDPSIPDPIIVRSYPVNWDDLEEGVWPRILMALKEPAGCFYLNPRYTVFCRVPKKTFFVKARKCQAAWCRTMGQVLRSSNRRKEARKRCPTQRQLMFTGMLIVDGVRLDPCQWVTMESDAMADIRTTCSP